MWSIQSTMNSYDHVSILKYALIFFTYLHFSYLYFFPLLFFTELWSMSPSCKESRFQIVTLYPPSVHYFPSFSCPRPAPLQDLPFAPCRPSVAVSKISQRSDKGSCYLKELRLCIISLALTNTRW